jgi:hypothetical protein
MSRLSPSIVSGILKILGNSISTPRPGFPPSIRNGLLWKLILICGVSPPRDESLLFRQKDPKPFLPVRGPEGAWAATPNHNGSETRSAQTGLAKEVGFGVEVLPRPTQ